MSPRWFRLLCSIYPPYLGAGVRVTYVSPDWREIRVRMPLRWYNRNYVGTHFGGSLYAMADPFFMIMLMKNLGPAYTVWDRAAEIEFVAPGRGTVTTRFELTDDVLEAIRAQTANGEKHLRWFSVDVVDAEHVVVTRVRKQLYVRKRQVSP